MAKKKDILDHASIGGMPYNVPDGYFENLQARLSVIPAEHPLEEVCEHRPALWTRLRPYLALAAAFIFMVVAGTGILKLSTKSLNSTLDSSYDLYSYASDILRTDPYVFYDSAEYESPTDEDIAEYLLNTGVPVEHIYYYGNE